MSADVSVMVFTSLEIGVLTSLLLVLLRKRSRTHLAER